VNKYQPRASDGIQTQLRDASRGWGPISYHYGVRVPKLVYPANKIFGYEWQPVQDDVDDDIDDDEDNIPDSEILY
jgi:hypothetical protein